MVVLLAPAFGMLLMFDNQEKYPVILFKMHVKSRGGVLCPGGPGRTPAFTPGSGDPPGTWGYRCT